MNVIWALTGPFFGLNVTLLLAINTVGRYRDRTYGISDTERAAPAFSSRRPLRL
jgi:hypothetical protein